MEAKCPICGRTGAVDMTRVGRSIYYVVDCGGCDKRFLLGLVWMPPPELADRYKAIMKELLNEHN